MSLRLNIVIRIGFGRAWWSPYTMNCLSLEFPDTKNQHVQMHFVSVTVKLFIKELELFLHLLSLCNVCMVERTHRSRNCNCPNQISLLFLTGLLCPLRPSLTPVRPYKDCWFHFIRPLRNLYSLPFSTDAVMIFLNHFGCRMTLSFPKNIIPALKICVGISWCNPVA